MCIKTFFFSFLLRLHQTFPQGFTGKRGENGLKCSRQHSVDITAKSASRFFMTGDTKCCLNCLEEDFLTASNAFAVSNVYRLTPDAQPYTSSCRVVFRIITKRSAILLTLLSDTMIQRRMNFNYLRHFYLPFLCAATMHN